MITSYSEAVKYLYDNLPIFQRVGASAFKPNLTNTLLLCEALGDPQKKFKTIHIAGTNGKGSTSHMLASVLQSAGYKTGLYTSPHLKNFTERIKVNGQEVSEDFVVSFVNRITPMIEKLKPSFFEITVAMAFEYFAQQRIDIAVIEVGLGGRLDSTNVITPLVSVITNIGWDHKDILGDTLPKIASEKAGIIKQNIPVVISEKQADVEEVFVAKAKEESAPLYFAEETWRAERITKHDRFYYDVFKNGLPYLSIIKLPLQGIYQQKNIIGVLGTIEILNRNSFKISEHAIRAGLEHVTEQTNFKGRWQKLSEAPLMICDTGHNIDGVREVVSQIRQQRVGHVHMIWGMVKDKDINDILEILPADASYYFCQAKIPRALDADTLAERARTYGLQGEVIPDVNKAILKALVSANENDLIFIGGSTFVVAEIDGL